MVLSIKNILIKINLSILNVFYKIMFPIVKKINVNTLLNTITLNKIKHESILLRITMIISITSNE